MEAIQYLQLELVVNFRNKCGTIEEGQKADILVIKGDPSKNIKILSDKKYIKVFKDGKLLENSI